MSVFEQIVIVVLAFMFLVLYAIAINVRDILRELKSKNKSDPKLGGSGNG